jgi:hypothetical protein
VRMPGIVPLPTGTPPVMPGPPSGGLNGSPLKILRPDPLCRDLPEALWLRLG